MLRLRKVTAPMDSGLTLWSSPTHDHQSHGTKAIRSHVAKLPKSFLDHFRLIAFQKQTGVCGIKLISYKLLFLNPSKKSKVIKRNLYYLTERGPRRLQREPSPGGGLGIGRGALGIGPAPTGMSVPQLCSALLGAPSEQLRS